MNVGHVGAARRLWLCAVLVAGMVLIQLAIPASAYADEHERHGRVLPPDSIVAGKSIGEWSAEWWKWAFSFLAGESPVFDDQTGELGHLGDVGGPVFFVGAVNDVKRSFSVPCRQYLLIPLLTQAWTLEGDDTEAFAREQNDAFVNLIDSLTARVDGERIPNLFSHRETTPELFSVTIPDGGLFGDEGGTFDAVADGYWIMLKPLSSGTHTISFGGSTRDGLIDYIARLKLTVTGKCRDGDD
jgi:hypothetical protein